MWVCLKLVYISIHDIHHLTSPKWPFLINIRFRGYDWPTDPVKHPQGLSGWKNQPWSMEPKDSCPMCSRCDVGAKICWILDAFIWDDEPWLYILHFFETCRMQLVFQYVMVELDETRGWSKKTTSLNSYPQKKQMSFVRTDLIWFAARFLAQLRPLIVLSWELQTQKTSRHLNHPKNARWVPALLPDPDNGMSSISTATRICKSINLLTLVDSCWLLLIVCSSFSMPRSQAYCVAFQLCPPAVALQEIWNQGVR